jgi:hypothetical protein
MKKPVRISLVVVSLALLVVSMMAASGDHWRTADRSSSGLAPDPQQFSEAIIQVYAARTFGWRGNLAVHTWISTKLAGAQNYTVHHVLGWRSRRNLPVVVSEFDIPDRAWYGNTPEVLVDIRGEQAEELLPKLLESINTYPFIDKYVMWPGPNSNTFTAYVGRENPELKLDLPPTAIGKDYLASDTFFDTTPGGSGYQFSVYGLFGLSLATEEGVEVNVLGLNFGINPMKLHLKLPGLGIVGKQSEILFSNQVFEYPESASFPAGTSTDRQVFNRIKPQFSPDSV